MKKFICLFMVLLLCVQLLGCTHTTNEDSSVEPLSIYLIQNEEIIPIIEDYNKIMGEERVRITEFEDMNALDMKIKGEIMADSGPDLIYFNSYTNNQSILKYISSGVFADLNELIACDSSEEKLDLSKFNDVVMDAGVYNNKRVFFPLTYRVNSFITTKASCDKYKINADEAFSYANLDERVNVFLEHQKKDESMYVSFPTTMFFDRLIENGVQFEEKAYSFETEKFKKEFSSVEKTYRTFNSGNDYDEITQFANGNILFLEDDFFSGNPYVAAMAAEMFGHINVLPKMISFSSCENSFESYVGSFLAINSNSRHKELAYDFIKYASSYGAQKKLQTNDIPVNSDAYDYFMDKAQEYIDEKISKEEMDIVETILLDYEKVISLVDTCRLDDNYFYVNIFGPCLSEYLYEDITYEEFIYNISSKTKIYLDE